MMRARHPTMVALCLLILPATARAGAGGPCPAAMDLPQLVIDRVENPAIPTIDNWQVLWDGVPLSDAQVAGLAKDDQAIDLTRVEMASRGTWVYIGMLSAAVGTAISCVGWVLFGQNTAIPEAASLAVALGGLGIGGAGVMLVTESIQTPLEPHLAPTPTHRLSRADTRRLVAKINSRLQREICEAAHAALPTSPDLPIDRAPLGVPEPQMP
ncbi:MAG: hypothetical protein HY903_06830 [Deltaproteobacteria bacterium]|nr:hypothetical protein [Deltaproteobacteria bacterium]